MGKARDIFAGRRLPALAIACLLGAAVLAPGEGRAQQLTCDSVLASAQTAQRARDVHAFQNVIAQVNARGSLCGVPELHCLGRAYSNLVAIRAKLDLNAGVDPARVDADLKQMNQVKLGANAIESTPLYMEANGDVNVKLKDWGAASYQYQAALNRFEEGSICVAEKMAPDRRSAERKRLHKLATTAFMLAPKFEAPPAARDGGPGGIFALMVSRDIEMVQTPLPINFRYNSTEFEGDGKKAAEMLADFLNRQKPTETVLTGHTDRVGDSRSNCELSKRRLDALAGFLKSKGVQTKLVLVAMGKEEPFETDNAADLSQAEIDRLNRRVSLRSDPARSRCGR